jgi:spore maturation protein CgeB
VEYVPQRGFADFDLVLSYIGGRALDELRSLLGARIVEPLYGSVDPEAHRRVETQGLPRFDLSYLGTYAADRQTRLDTLFIEPARQRPDQRFVIGGSQYPDDFPWTPNMYYLRHLPPSAHPAFYSASPLTLNVTRDAMATFGYCPSGRLFEAAACGAAILTDSWEGLEQFFTPDAEILVARTTADALDAIDLPSSELARIGDAALTRTLAQHTSDRRAGELESILESTRAMLSHT